MKNRKGSTVYLSDLPIPYFFDAKSDDQGHKMEMLQHICEFTGEALGADACSIFLVDQDNRQIARQIAGTGYQKAFVDKAEFKIVEPDKVIDEPKNEENKLGITGWILSTGKPLLIRNPEELYQHPHHLGKYDDKQLGNETSRKIQAFIGVPIWGTHQNLIGLIKAEREQKDDVEGFSEHDESSLIKIAEGIGHCLKYYNISKDKKHVWDAIKAWTLDVIAIASSEEQDLPAFIQSMVELLRAIAKAESCSLFLLDADGKYLTQYGGCGYQINGCMIRSYRMPPDQEIKHEGLTTFIVSSKKIFYARIHNEIKNHPAWKGSFDKQNFGDEHTWCEALLGIPLIAGIDAIGVIKFENSNNFPKLEDPFPAEVIRNLSLLAQHIALSILRLHSQASQRLHLIETATKTINEILSGGGRLEIIVERAINEFKKALNAECCALFLKENDKLVQSKWGAAGYANNVQEDKPREYKLVPRDKIVDNPKDNEKVGLTVWIAATGQKFIAKSHDDLEKHPHWLGTYDKENFSEGDKCDSFIGVPLIINNEILGVLKIENKKEPGHERRIAFTKEDELVFDLLASSIANFIFNLKKSPDENRKNFINQFNGSSEKIWALGLLHEQTGLHGFEFNFPPIPDDSVVVQTLFIGICGTDIQSFGGSQKSEYTVIEFHEAIGKVVWAGKNVDAEQIKIGDIVVPIVRRCQTWDNPLTLKSSPDDVDFTFNLCKEAPRCHNYHRPDICSQGEYPYKSKNNQLIGYRSRGTGKCHGFGSKFFIDTAEWLVRACTSDEYENDKIIPEAINRLILVEPLSVVWKMKREIENVRPIRPFQDSVLILGLGPIGYLAAVLICKMYPGIKCVAVDRSKSSRSWITKLRKKFHVNYLELPGETTQWHSSIERTDRFDIVIEATGHPQNVIDKAIEVLAPNGALVLLSVLGKDDNSSANISSTNLSAIVRKNGKIIGSVNESRNDFENAISFLRTFHSDISSPLDSLINELDIDPDTWKVIENVEDIKNTKIKERRDGPKIILKAPL